MSRCPFALILGARIVPFALILGARIVPFALILGARIVPFALILGARIVPFALIPGPRIVPFALILGPRIVPFALIPGARIVPFALILGARIVPFALTLGVRIVRLVCPCDSSQRNRHGSCGHRGEQHFLEHSLTLRFLLVLSMSSATAQRYRSLAASCALSDDSVYCSMFASLWPLPFLRLYQRVSPCRIGARSTLGIHFSFHPLLEP